MRFDPLLLQSMTIASCLPTRATEGHRSVFVVSSWSTTLSSHWGHLFSKLSSTVLAAFPHLAGLLAPGCLDDVLADTVFQMWSTKYQVKEDIHFLPLAGFVSLHTARMFARVSASQARCWFTLSLHLPWHLDPFLQFFSAAGLSPPFATVSSFPGAVSDANSC